MYVPFNEMKDSSRIWIFQSDKTFTESNLDKISEKLYNFCQDWKAHNKPLLSSFAIFFDRFVVLAVDESFNQVSGCAIDASVRVLSEIEKECGITLFDRFQVAYRDGNAIVGCNLQTFKRLVKEGELGLETLVFNNVVNTKKDLENNWIVPVKQSWHFQYVK